MFNTICYLIKLNFEFFISNYIILKHRFSSILYVCEYLNNIFHKGIFKQSIFIRLGYFWKCQFAFRANFWLRCVVYLSFHPTIFKLVCFRYLFY